jgi:ribosome-binding protein aMBF1 (putative translation factor)
MARGSTIRKKSRDRSYQRSMNGTGRLSVTKTALDIGKENKKDERLELNKEYGELIVKVYDKLDQSGWVRDKLVHQIDHSRKVVLTSIIKNTALALK